MRLDTLEGRGLAENNHRCCPLKHPYNPVAFKFYSWLSVDSPSLGRQEIRYNLLGVFEPVHPVLYGT